MDDRQPADPAEFGIGMRYSLHPASDDYVDVILSAIAEAGDGAGTLDIDTGPVSTYVGATAAPAEPALAGYLLRTVGAAARAMDGGHLVTHVLLSRGCPGEMECTLLDRFALPEPEAVVLERAGVDADVQWSLYPLMDGDSGHGAHLEPIERAIEQAKQSGLEVTPAHFATMLRGDLAQALELVFTTWSEVGRSVPHVVCHLTISIGSPSRTEQHA